VVKIEIFSLKNNKTEIEIKATLAESEFDQLSSSLNNLCVFAIKAIKEETKCIKTGARHSHAKYLLFPKALRRKLNTSDFDFEKLTCGTVEFEDKLFVIFGLPRKGLVIQSDKEHK